LLDRGREGCRRGVARASRPAERLGAAAWGDQAHARLAARLREGGACGRGGDPRAVPHLSGRWRLAPEALGSARVARTAVSVLARLNAEPAAEAAALLTSCCGATVWVERMLAHRPFASEAAVLEAGDEAFADLSPRDWDEAFRAHPRIGDRGAHGE